MGKILSTNRLLEQTSIRLINRSKPKKKSKKNKVDKAISEEQIIAELTTMKKQVAFLLERHPSSRNCDFYLQLLYLKIFGGLDNLPYIEWEKIKHLSGKLDTVTRIRRVIQNQEGRLLPTDPEVLKRRRRRAKAFRKAVKRLQKPKKWVNLGMSKNAKTSVIQAENPENRLV
jgi:hypothetical protein